MNICNDAQLHVPVVTLLKHDNAKIFRELKSGFNKKLIGININQIQKHMHKTYI